MAISIEFEGLPGFFAALNKLGKNQKAAHLRFWREYYLSVLRQRYELTRQQTPYAANSRGTRKRISRARRGYPGDPGFGFDSGRAQRELTTEENLRIGENSSELSSGVEYVSLLHQRFARKGPFPGQGILFISDADGDRFADVVFEEIEREWMKQ